MAAVLVEHRLGHRQVGQEQRRAGPLQQRAFGDELDVVEVGERQHGADAVGGHELGQRRHVAGVGRARDDGAAVGLHERGRERIGVDGDHVAVPAEPVERLAERAHDVDALAGAGEQHGALAHRSQPPVVPL